MPVYYHYTNKAGRDGIKQAGRIRQSRQLDAGDDAAYGPGVYLTTVDPNKGRREIVITCWGPSFYPTFADNGRVDYAFRITIPANSNRIERATKKRAVFLYEGDLILDEYSWEIVVVPAKH